MQMAQKPILALAKWVAFWALPDYRHPLRYALRQAGIEPWPIDRPAQW